MIMIATVMMRMMRMMAACQNDEDADMSKSPLGSKANSTRGPEQDQTGHGSEVKYIK